MLGIDEPRVGLLSNGRSPPGARADVLAAHAEARRSDPALRFVGNVEGTGLVAGAADVVVTDGFTGNVALKPMEGAAEALIGAIRDTRHELARARRPAACCCAPRCAACATRSIPRPRAAPICSACAALGVVAARPLLAPRASPRRSPWPCAASRSASSTARHEGLEAAGALRGASAEPATVQAQ